MIGNAQCSWDLIGTTIVQGKLSLDEHRKLVSSLPEGKHLKTARTRTLGIGVGGLADSKPKSARSPGLGNTRRVPYDYYGVETLLSGEHRSRAAF